MQLEVAAVVESDETKNIKLENASNLKTKKKKYHYNYGPVRFKTYRERQNKISQRENSDICVAQKHFYTEFSLFIQYMFPHKSV